MGICLGRLTGIENWHPSQIFACLYQPCGTAAQPCSVEVNRQGFANKFMDLLYCSRESVRLAALQTNPSYKTPRPVYQLADCAVQTSDIPAKQGLRACL